MQTVKQGREFTGRVIYRHKGCKGIAIVEIEPNSNALSTLLNTNVNRDGSLTEASATWHVRTFGREIDRPVCSGCGAKFYHWTGQPVYGKFVETVVCGSKCMGAVGPSCDCSCGGANHAGGH